MNSTNKEMTLFSIAVQYEVLLFSLIKFKRSVYHNQKNVLIECGNFLLDFECGCG